MLKLIFFFKSSQIHKSYCVLCTLLDLITLDILHWGDGDGSEGLVRTLSRTVKDLRFTCMLQVSPAITSWTLGWSQMTLHLTAQQAAQVSSSHQFPLPSQCHRGDAEWSRGLLSMQWGGFASQLRNPKFRLPESFIINTSNSAQLLPRGETLCLLYNSKQTCLLHDGNTASPKAVHYINLLDKDSVEQRLSKLPLSEIKAVKASALENCF